MKGQGSERKRRRRKYPEINYHSKQRDVHELQRTGKSRQNIEKYN